MITPHQLHSAELWREQRKIILFYPAESGSSNRANAIVVN
jgi:hypothetical protein